MSEDDLTQARRAKLDELRVAGNAYPNSFRPEHKAGLLQTEAEADTAETLEAAARQVCVAGRVMAKRSFGKALFLVLEDESGRIQAYLRKNDLPEEVFALAKATDVGDRIGVRGRLMRTRTGELTVAAAEMELIAKCLHPLPEKWHGLTDVEVRYRQRYLDLIATPGGRDAFRKRAKVMAGIRDFLNQRDFVEVETPILQTVAGGAAARPFLTKHNTLDMDLQLRIAPELFLKRLLVGGFERVYEIGRNFRNEGISTRHNPEFTMLEFYQAYATCDDLLPMVETLVAGLAEAVAGGTRIPCGEGELDLTPPWTRLDLLTATAEKAGCSTDDLRDDAKAVAVAARHHVKPPPGAHAGGIATALFEELVEPTLMEPTFVTGFPAEVSPLARPNDDDPFLVDRFELYCQQREIANGFSELNDPDLQRERFEAQLESRASGDDEAHPMDEDYVHALEYAMPHAAGCGIGIDRLVMLLCGLPSIRDVILFPLLRKAATE
ncbi:MAG: lysine--tRNA ligase [Deltaproteobacteria bacterium]